MAYESVIGLEVHLQLKTATKLFCGCRTTFGRAPNSQTCPVCLGLPGVLPVLNQRAFAWGIKVALAFDCQLTPRMQFDRKQYFYPDLPKNFQISQYDHPLAHHGHLAIAVNGSIRRINIRRIHLEEDAGKLLHEPNAAVSFVDFNRTGVPLLEIVSEPDLRTPEEAYQYLVELKAVVQYLDVSTCNMEEGSLRCDTNISLRPTGRETLGSKVEIKNLNSFRAVRQALDFEIARQASLLDRGERIVQETRLWNAQMQATELMRSKEEAADYRYFPEPDLLPFLIEASMVARMRDELPELPAQRRQRYRQLYRLSAYDAQVMTQQRVLGELFEGAVRLGAAPKPVVNWIMGDLMAYLNATHLEPEALEIQPAWLVHLVKLVEEGTLSGKMAKAVFVQALERRTDPADLVQEGGLQQISDPRTLEQLAQEVIAQHPKSLQDYRKGKTNALMYLVGQAMKRSQGKANPQHMKEILKRKVEEMAS